MWNCEQLRYPRPAILAAAVLTPASAALAQDVVEPEESFTLWGLFWGSADLFTLLLVIGSIVAAAVIVRCVMRIKPAILLAPESTEAIRHHLRAGRYKELERFVEEDDAFSAAVVRAAMRARSAGASPEGITEAAELAASQRCADWFRMIEPLSIVGNLGPLLGLAGTVWGMIIAFASLGEAGGQAGPAELSIGISKALFHTLLGLMLAVPALTVFGFYRSYIDKLCNRAMLEAAELVDMVPPLDLDPGASPATRSEA